MIKIDSLISFLLGFDSAVGANVSLLFSFSYTYLLSCILFLFALRYFVNYAPLLRAVCKFSCIACYLTLFFTQSFTCLSV